MKLGTLIAMLKTGDPTVASCQRCGQNSDGITAQIGLVGGQLRSVDLCHECWTAVLVTYIATMTDKEKARLAAIVAQSIGG